MKSIKNFENLKIQSSHMIFGGGTSGTGSCNTSCNGPGSAPDCNTYSYEDDCNGDNRVILESNTSNGNCQ